MRIKNLTFGEPTTFNLVDSMTKKLWAKDVRVFGRVSFDIVEDEKTTSYQTDNNGEGLWVWTDDYSKHQILGTCQFDLQCTPNAARKRIHKWWEGTTQW